MPLSRLTTYARVTMKQERLNHVTVLHAHRNNLDSIDVQKVKTDFVRKNDLGIVFSKLLEVWSVAPFQLLTY